MDAAVQPQPEWWRGRLPDRRLLRLHRILRGEWLLQRQLLLERNEEFGRELERQRRLDSDLAKPFGQGARPAERHLLSDDKRLRERRLLPDDHGRTGGELAGGGLERQHLVAANHPRPRSAAPRNASRRGLLPRRQSVRLGGL